MNALQIIDTICNFVVGTLIAITCLAGLGLFCRLAYECWKFGFYCF